MHKFRPAAAFLGTGLLLCQAHGANLVQIDLSKILDARSASTVTGGKLNNWDKGMDDGWSGVATVSATTALGGTVKGTVLRNDGFYAATSTHPGIQLNAHDGDGTAPQVKWMGNTNSVSFGVPLHKYKSLSLVLSSSGNANVTATAHYTDGSTTSTSATVLNWYEHNQDGIHPDPKQFYLVWNLDKWNKNGAGYWSEPLNHEIAGLRVSVDANKTMDKVTLSRTSGGLAFWAATGETDEQVSGVEERMGNVISVRMADPRTAELEWNTSKPGRWSLFAPNGQFLSTGEGSRVRLPSGGLFLINASLETGSTLFRVVGN